MLLAALFCSFWAQAETVGSAVHPVNAALAVVADEVFTLRKVAIYSVVEHWLLVRMQAQDSKGLEGSEFVKTHTERKDWIPEWGTAALRTETSTLVADALVLREFKETEGRPNPSLQNAEELAKALTEELKGWAPWQNLEVSSDELKTFLDRHLRASDFLRMKAEATGYQVNEADVKAYYEYNKLQFNGLDFSLFKEGIRKFLIRRQTESSLKTWMDSLRVKYHARLLLD